VLALGLWAEIARSEWALAATRVNMAAALATAGLALVSARIVCRVPVHRPIIFLLAPSAAVNVATVWLCDGAVRRTGGLAIRRFELWAWPRLWQGGLRS